MYTDYYDYYDYGNSYGSSIGTGILGGILVFYYLFILAIAVLQIVAMWKVFKKAGKNGWEAIIPFYNTWTLFEISGYPGYYMFFVFIPCVGPIVLLVFEILAYISLSKKFNKSSGFAVLLIFLSVVGFCILGFGNDTYDSTLGEQKNTQPINPPEDNVTEAKNTTTTNKKTEEIKKFCGNCGTKVNASANVCPNCGTKLK